MKVTGSVSAGMAAFLISAITSVQSAPSPAAGMTVVLVHGEVLLIQ